MRYTVYDKIAMFMKEWRETNGFWGGPHTYQGPHIPTYPGYHPMVKSINSPPFESH